MKKTYRVYHAGYVVEGRATSPQNACRRAFKELIKNGKIKKQPPSDINSPSSFKDTEVRVMDYSNSEGE